MIRLDVTIMGQPYALSCNEGEETRLLEAVLHLDGCMNAIRMAGKIKGIERIAVMAALGIAVELIEDRALQDTQISLSELHEKFAKMHVVLDDLLAQKENLF